MTVLGRAILFTSSYAPLLVLLAVLDPFRSKWAAITCAGVAVASVLGLVVMWRIWTHRLGTQQAEFTGAANRDSDVTAYVVTYVVPFAAATETATPNTRWALGVFAVLIAALYLRSAVFYVHPLLLIAGVHVFAVRRSGVPAVILTRQSMLRQSCAMRVSEIAPNVYLERPT